MLVQHDLPPGFVRISGEKNPPRGTLWNIALRCGWSSTDRVYSAEQLDWHHKLEIDPDGKVIDPGAADIIGVRKVG